MSAVVHRLLVRPLPSIGRGISGLLWSHSVGDVLCIAVVLVLFLVVWVLARKCRRRREGEAVLRAVRRPVVSGVLVSAPSLEDVPL
ncbi:hypothetical protein OESDEN_24098 [Oesophagostomum dentatum]|uniref:Uncharacterized protein n=1 Tax=Oesophagostomum dentatum TaxID=61180 RepID=A0A0B1RYI6_OESDE|nr:hypothetical protein OESDEN_24098 [Oesophagostomum dentatum]